MKPPIPEENVNETATEVSKLVKKATGSQRRAHVASPKGKAGKKATPAKKAPRGAKKATHAEGRAIRSGSKTDKILALLRQPGGVTASALQKASGWQAHSRGFLSGTVGKKMGLTVVKGEDGDRNYSIEA